MSKNQFVNRTHELDDLENLWARPAAQMVVIYGRRRTGKTALLSHFLRDKKHLFWVATRLPSTTLLGDLSRTLYAYQYPNQPVMQDFTYASWEMALRTMGEIARTNRVGVVIDELPYAVEAEPGLPSLLQRLWDHELKQTEIFLALCGSHVGMMERELMAYRAPLYGRRTGQILLKPMDFAAFRQFFPRWSPAQQLTAYAVLGGIPSYWEQFEPTHSLEANIRERILRSSSLLYQEPFFLIYEELREPRNYLGILRAIAQGNRQMQQIASASGVSRTNLPRYLDTLRDLRLVTRLVPVTELNPDQSRRGLYQLGDNFLEFYFRFVAPYHEELEQGYLDRAWQNIDSQLNAFVGNHAFEAFCRQSIAQQGRRGHLPFIPENVGSYWDASVQVDVVALNRSEQIALLGEARWTSRPLGMEVFHELQAKAKQIPALEGWHMHYALFSRSGFTESLRQEATRQHVLLFEFTDMLSQDYSG